MDLVTEKGTRLAVWQTGLDGLGWIEALVVAGAAVQIQCGGYPHQYVARTWEVRPTLLAGPPGAYKTWRCDEGDVLLDNWVGKTLVDETGLQACAADEWLLIVAWDES